MVSEPNGQRHPPQQRKPPRRRASIIRIFCALKRYENRRRCRAKQEKTDRDLIMARWTRRVGIFTAALVAVGFGTGVIFWRQLNVMQGQLDEMRGEQRPWISNSIVETTSPLRKERDKLTLTVKYRLKNVGKLPAFRVFFYATLSPIRNALDISINVKIACANIIDRMKDDIANAGFVLFPDEPTDTTFRIEDANFADFAAGPSGFTTIEIPACVVYQYGSASAEFSYTPVAYALIASGPPVGWQGFDMPNFPTGGMPVEIRRMAQGSMPPR